ncbi:MAG: prolyl-tRNA synthetase associated domain-containing protein [Clostridia bacterium]|nr:prolyl-tRNA synthetase associated domain-containing protein [Clostridia bacterium]MBQ7788659.1 prolyl-tRNA synthetase associated domain-containing protein [Clostridia bacterium]
MQVYIGRPKNEEGREKKEIRVYDLLDSLGMEYYRVDHTEANTMQDCEKVDMALNTVLCKNLFLSNRQKTSFYLLMMPASKEFRTAVFSKIIGSSRLSFADTDAMEKYLDVTPGSVSIMGLMNDKENNVQLVIDKDVLVPEHIGCHPCINTSSLKLKTDEILNKYLPAVHHTPIIIEQ